MSRVGPAESPQTPVCVAGGGRWPVLSSVRKPEAAVTQSGREVAPGAACRRDPIELVV